jgi:excisionase family DNA binding protein
MRLTVREAALEAKVSMSMVYQWCHERRLPHLRLGGRGKRGRIGIEDTDLKSFLQTLRIEAEDEEQLTHIR